MPRLVRSVLAYDGARRTLSGKTRRFRVVGVVFTFWSDNRREALQDLVSARAENVDGVIAFYKAKDASASQTSEVSKGDAVGVGYYRVQTLLDEAESETTDVRFGW